MILKQKVTSFLPYILFAIVFFKSNTLMAQFQNNEDLFIGDNSVLYSESGNFVFGSGSTITTRTELDYGLLSFSNGSTWSGTNDDHYVDGYVQTLSNTTFTFPIGQYGVYAPIQVVPSTLEGIDAAYFRSDPSSIGGNLNKSISLMSSVEYWNVRSSGSDATISLSWRLSSAISKLTESALSNLTIVGWNGSSWEQIPSKIDNLSIQGETSSLNSGSISSESIVDLSVYSSFSFGNKHKLSSPEISKLDFNVALNEGVLSLVSSSRISAMVIYDVTGKKVMSEKVGGEYNYNTPFYQEEAVYIAKIVFDDGASVTKKIINRRVIR